MNNQQASVSDRIKHIITFECDECQRQYKDNKIYEETVYANTIYSDIDPEPKWKCPEHPNATGCLLIEDVEDEYDNNDEEDCPIQGETRKEENYLSTDYVIE